MNQTHQEHHSLPYKTKGWTCRPRTEPPRASSGTSRTTGDGTEPSRVPCTWPPYHYKMSACLTILNYPEDYKPYLNLVPNAVTYGCYQHVFFFLSIYCLLNMWHPAVQPEINTEDAKPITFLSFIHALHAWKRQMALWAAFYRSRFVKDKEDKDMKDKPDRKDSAGEPVDEVEQIQREILTRCAGKEIQETSKIRKQMKNYFRKKKPRTWPKKSNKQWKVWSKSRCCWRSHQGKSKRLERRALMMQPQKPRPDICAAKRFPKYCVQLCEQST